MCRSTFQHLNIFQPIAYPDRAVRREIQQTEVFCKNSTQGCQWIGPLNKYLKVSEIVSVRFDNFIGPKSTICWLYILSI